jgi:hypothetical protein
MTKSFIHEANGGTNGLCALNFDSLNIRSLPVPGLKAAEKQSGLPKLSIVIPAEGFVIQTCGA